MQNETFRNPAQIGLNPNIFRLYTSAKLQWYSVTKPYQTYMISADGQILKRVPHMDQLGGNLMVLENSLEMPAMVLLLLPWDYLILKG